MLKMAPSMTYKLVSVNKVPARAKVIIGRVVEAVKDTYTIDYAANAESMISCIIPWTAGQYDQPYNAFCQLVLLPPLTIDSN